MIGSQIQTQPLKVTNITIDKQISDIRSLQLNWTALVSHEESGGSPVVNYKIRFNQGLTINSWIDVETITATASPSYLLTGLTPGMYY